MSIYIPGGSWSRRRRGSTERNPLDLDNYVSRKIASEATGIEGEAGKSVLNGTVDPTTEGVDGDFYINTNSYEIFGPKTAGNWGSGTSLVGDEGPTGPNGTLAAWNGEFSKPVMFDNTTGLLNQIGSGNIVFVSDYNDTFVNGGANYRIVDFDCHSDASDAINVIYGDFNASGTTTIASSALSNLPSIPTGRSRLVLGVCIKTGDADFKLYSRYFKYPKDHSKYYPFDRHTSNNLRDGNLMSVIDIPLIELDINHPSDLYYNGKLVKIAPNFMANGGLFRWSKYDEEGNSLGFITTSNISTQSGVATVDLPETAQSGIRMSITMDFDLMDGSTQYSFDEEYWYLDDAVLLKAIQDWMQIKNIDYYTNNSLLQSAAKLKLNDGTDTHIALFGDSMTTYLTGGSDNNNPENLPPSCQTQYVPYWLYNDIVRNKPVYDRYDSTVNTFTESGTFANTEPFSGSTADKRGGELTRFSSTSSAYVEFDWDLSAYRNLNFIFATDDGNANDLTVTVSTGDGDVEVYDVDTTSWIEANNYTFDQIAEGVDSGTGDLGWTLNDRLKFRRVATSGTPTIRIAKGANVDVLYYWGTERYNGATIIFGNEAHTANSLTNLEGKYNSNLFSKYKYYNYIIFELPLINESAADLTALKNAYHDFIWGDRPGNLNSDSLKDRSNDWADFQLLIYLPQMPRNNYDVAGGYSATGITAVQKWNTLIELLEEKGDIPYIDGRQLVERMSSLRNVTQYSLTTGVSTNTDDYTTLSYDDIHTNTLGSHNVSKIISPNFM